MFGCSRTQARWRAFSWQRTLNRHRFGTLPPCVTNYLPHQYAVFMWEVSETGDDSTFASWLHLSTWRYGLYFVNIQIFFLAINCWSLRWVHNPLGYIQRSKRTKPVCLTYLTCASYKINGWNVVETIYFVTAFSSFISYSLNRLNYISSLIC